MNYPLWDFPHLGGALLIAGISIFHVIIAHFAVGAGLFNVVTETGARRTKNAALLRFVRDNSIFLIYLAFVAGAVSGVGIWFTIGVVAPEATAFKIRLFLWVWATEWVFFALELASGYVYYYTWDRISGRSHVLVGWMYAISAILSLVLINGILAFMLTPGDWQSTHSLWDAWLNPSFWPSMCMRMVSGLALAGVFVAVVASLKTDKYSHEDRSRIVAWGARFLIPLATMPFLAYWYFSTLPSTARTLALGGAVAMTFIFAFGVILSFLIAMYALFGMLHRPKDINLVTALLMSAIAFLATGSMEFVREGIRKPYILMDIMYSNGILVNDVSRLNREGVLTNAVWVKPDTTHYEGDVAIGEAVYRVECLRCHEVTGYNAVTPLVWNWNKPLIMTALDQLDRMKAFMPPFVGTENEKQALGSYLYSLTVEGTSHDTLTTPAPNASEADTTASDSGQGGAQ
jgi:cytochrome bd-type quinol oxidase subunit 1